MGFFSGLEGSLEKYIEGFFKDKFKGELQPVDIAKELAREMRNQRRAGLNEIYVPNRFDIYLSPVDMDEMVLLIDKLAREMTEFVTARAAEKEYTLLGAVNINFMEQQDIAAGQLKIESFFDETITRATGEPEVQEETLKFKPIKHLGQGTGSLAEQPRPRGYLVVLAGPQKGRQFALDGNQTEVGRREICAVYLQDTSVSRRHAVITRSGESYLIRDHNSTNGTYVNGKKIRQTQLESGDVITIGRVELGFKVE